MDDMVDTAGTLCKAAQALKEQRRQACARLLHAPVLSGKVDRIASPSSTNWS
jgi:phosphoribosylpyrophosphate synthetase